MPPAIALRKSSHYRRLVCEPLEDRRLLSVGVPKFGFALGAGAAENDYGQAVAIDAAGNVFVTGSFEGTVDFDPGPETSNLADAGQGDIFVAKYSPDGSLVWARRLGGGGGDDVHGIAVADDGSVYTTGYFSDTADFDPGDGVCNLTSAGGLDIFVSKLDSAGNFVCAVGMGGTEDDSANDITVADDGSIYTTGSFGGTVDFDSSQNVFNLTSAGGDDIFVSKLDSSGNFIWADRMGGTGGDYGRGIAVAAGNVFVTGSFFGTADFDPGTGTANLTSAGDSDVFVSKLNVSGNAVWARNIGGAGDDWGSDIAVDSQENIYTTGSFLGTADFNPGSATFHLTSAGGSDIFVSKLNASGDFAWAASMGGSSYDEGHSIAVDSQQRVCTTGYFLGTADFDPGANALNLTSAGSSDAFLSMLDSSGNVLWGGHFGGSESDEGNGIAVATDGSVCTIGDFSATIDFDPGISTFNLTSAGKSDVFVSKLLVNVAPTNISLSANSLAENQPSGTAVGTFSTTDPNSGDTFLYTLVDGAGATNNASFTIDGNILKTAVSFDYEIKNSYSVRVRCTDQDGLYTEKTFTITVTDVNLAPTNFLLSHASVAENQPAGTVVGTFSTADPEPPAAPFVYSFVSGEGDNDNGSFTIVDNRLQTAASFDFETNPSYSIRVRSTDQDGLYIETTFTIVVTDVNVAPTDLSLFNARVAENQLAGTVVGTFSTTDSEPPAAPFIYSLVSGEGDNDNSTFTILGDQLQTATTFDFETNPSYSIRVRSTEQGGLFIEKTFVINVIDVAEQSPDILLSNASVVENQPAGTAVGSLSTTGPDAGGTFIYSLVGGDGSTDNLSFTLNGDTIQTTALFNCEAKKVYNIRVRSTDQGGLWIEKAFTINVTNVNEAPTNVVLSNDSVSEIQPSGTVIGTFSTTDADNSNTFSYNRVDGAGDTGNSLFAISGNTLQTTAIFDYEAQNSYSIRIRSTDQGGLFFEKTFTIAVSNVNEQPANVSLSAASVAENQPTGTGIGTFSTTDPDAGNTFAYTLVSGTGSTDNASFTISGNILQPAATFNYEGKSSYSIRVRSTDQGGLWTEKAFTINVTDVNEQPMDISLSNANMAENQPSGTTVGAFSTTDPDGNNTFTYSLIAGTGSTDNASFTISGNTIQTAAIFNYEAKSSYSIRVCSTDQGGLYTEKVFTIGVMNVNEQPRDISLSSASVTENQPSGTVVGGLSTTDPDASNTFAYSLVTGMGSTDNASFTISGNILETAASFDYETKNAYSVRVRSTDQDGLWTEKTFLISVTDVIEQPQSIILSTNSVIVPEDGTAQFSVILKAKPQSDVIVTINKQAGDTDLSANPTSLTFTSTNWNQAQTVTLIAQPDADANNGTASFVVASTGLTSQAVTATEQDDDTPGITVSPTAGLSTTEAGGTATLTIQLKTKPTASVTIGLSSSDTSEGTVLPMILTFTPSNWDTPQTVIITGVDDQVVDGNVAYTIMTATASSMDANYQGLDAVDVSVANSDNDVESLETWQDTIGLFSSASSKFYLRNTNDIGYADLTFGYGPANTGWRPITGDWDQDGTGTIGLYNPTTSKFYLRNTNDAGIADLTFVYGPAGTGWLPIAGDWDGDGTDTIGLYNPTTSKFYLRNANEAGVADLTFVYGPANTGWLPIIGDWNSDGTDTVGLYNPTTSKFYLRNTNDVGYADLTFSYGPANTGWKPIAGDWDVDGTDTIGLYKPTTSVFYLRDTNDAGYADATFSYGPANADWLPIVGDWNGVPSALRVVGRAIVPTPNTAPLTGSVLQPIVAEAIARWTAAGVSASSLSVLNNVNYRIVDLPGSFLGLTDANGICIDRDAAGHGWFVDATPADDTEFTADASSGGSDSPAADRADLLTTVMHEMGHLLGHDHDDAGLMDAVLPLGVRRAAVDQAFVTLHEA